MEVSETEAIRKVFQDKTSTVGLVERLINDFIHLNFSAPEMDYLAKICRGALNVCYKDAIEKVFEFSESPIEIYFLNSLIFNFLVKDPFHLRVDFPYDNGIARIGILREYYQTIIDIDNEYLTDSGTHKGWLEYINDQLNQGYITTEEYRFHYAEYFRCISLGGYHGFILSIQSKFPTIKVDGRSVRVDIFIWKPADINFKLIIECDGYKYHSGKSSFTSDRQRDRILHKHGFDILRFSGKEIYDDPKNIVNEVFDYLHPTTTTNPR